MVKESWSIKYMILFRFENQKHTMQSQNGRHAFCSRCYVSPQNSAFVFVLFCFSLSFRNSQWCWGLKMSLRTLKSTHVSVSNKRLVNKKQRQCLFLVFESTQKKIALDTVSFSIKSWGWTLNTLKEWFQKTSLGNQAHERNYVPG